MARYLTGNQRTISFSADVIGQYEQISIPPPPGGPTGGGPVDPTDPPDPTDPLVPRPFCYATVGFNANGCGVIVTPRTDKYFDTETNTAYLRFGANATLTTTHGTVEGYNYAQYEEFPTTQFVMEWDISGSVVFEYDVQEYVDFIEGTSTSNPWYIGIPDLPPYTFINVWERVIAVRATSGVGGVSLSIGYSFTDPTWAYDVTYGAVGEISAYCGGTGSGDFSITPHPDLPSPDFVRTGTDMINGTGSVSGWCAVSISSRLGIPVTGAIRGGCYVASFLPKPVSVGVQVFAMENPYPGNLTAAVFGVPNGDGTLNTTVALTGGAGSISGVQNIYYGYGSVTEDTDTDHGYAYTSPVISNYSYLTADITSDSLTANGESSDLARLLGRGYTFGGLSLSQAETYPTPEGITWPAAGATFTPEWPSGSYPFLRLSLVGAGGSAMAGTITIPPCSTAVENGSTTTPVEYPPESDVYDSAGMPGMIDKTWNFVTGDDGATQTVEIPLYAPDNISGSPDTQDTDWPYPVRRPMYAGVWRIPSITVALTSPGTGQTVQVLSAELFRSTSPPKCTFVPTFCDSQYSETDDGQFMTPEWPVQGKPMTNVGEEGHSHHYARRHLLAVQDGIQSVELADLEYASTRGTTGTSSIQFVMNSIQDTCDKVNGQIRQLGSGGTFVGLVDNFPGWTASAGTPIPADYVPGTFPDDLPPLHDQYLNASRYSTCISGAGLFRSGSTLSSRFDLGGGDSAQVLYDKCNWYPGWGGFDGSGAGMTMGAILRGEAQGQVLRPAAAGASPNGLTGHKRPHAPGTSLTLTQLDAAPAGMNVGVVAGTAISDADGWYHTGAPAGRAGGISHSIAYSDPTGAAEQDMIGGGSWWARHRHRRTFYGVPCPTLFLGDPLSYFPFTPQFSDPNVLPTEEWRRIRVAADSTASAADSASASASAADSSSDEDGASSNGSGTS